MPFPAPTSDRAAAFIAFLVIVALSVFAGYLLGSVHAEPEVIKQEAAPEQRNAPNDVVLKKTPGATPTKPAPKMPDGATSIGVVEIDVDGGAPVASGVDEAGCPTYTCPDLSARIDFAERDGQLFAGVHTDDGRYVTGSFIPEDYIRPRVPTKHLTVLWVPEQGWMAAGTKRIAGRLNAGVGVGQIDGETYAGLAVGFSLP